MTTRSQLAFSGLSDEELTTIEHEIQSKFKWTHTPRVFQVKAVKGILQRRDVLIHAGTGMGKTAVAAGAFASPKINGMVAFMVSPIIALQEEQVSTAKKGVKIFTFVLLPDADLQRRIPS